MIVKEFPPVQFLEWILNFSTWSHVSCLHLKKMLMSLSRKTPWLPNADTCLPIFHASFACLNSIQFCMQLPLCLLLRWPTTYNDAAVPYSNFGLSPILSLLDMRLVCIFIKSWCHFLACLDTYLMPTDDLLIYHSFVVTKHFNTVLSILVRKQSL